MNQIYDIDAQLSQLVDPETGEILDYDGFCALSIERDHLVEGTALWIQELKRQAEAIAAEKRLQDRKATIEGRVDRLSEHLGNYLDHQKLQTDLVTVSFRRSEAVIVEPGARLTDDMLRVKYEANKTAIKAALKAGQEIPGCWLEQRINTIVA